MLSQYGSPVLQKCWTLVFNEFISIALTSTFTLDEPELYNPLAGFRGQQQRGPEGRENHSLPGKNWHPIFNLIYQCKAKIDRVSLLHRELSWRDVSKPPHFDLAQRINTTLYCFNLRTIDFSMLTPYRGTFIIKQAYSMDPTGHHRVWSAYFSGRSYDCRAAVLKPCTDHFLIYRSCCMCYNTIS